LAKKYGKLAAPTFFGRLSAILVFRERPRRQQVRAGHETDWPHVAAMRFEWHWVCYMRLQYASDIALP
jgi:hypothetical protein